MRTASYIDRSARTAAPPGGPAPRIAQVCSIDPATNVLALKDVPFLPMGFDPKSNTTPVPDGNIPINSDVQQDLKAAFNAAAGFQNQLCGLDGFGLDGIFIDPTGCAVPNAGSSYDPHTCNLNHQQIAENSWGLRTYPPNPNPGKRYIALSLGLWNNQNQSGPWSCSPMHACAPPFQTFKTKLIAAHLSRAAKEDQDYPQLDITSRRSQHHRTRSPPTLRR